MFVNSSIPYLESSRPIPLCRTPPNGIRGSETTTLLTVTSPDRKSTRLNSSHSQISYAVFCLKKKKKYSLISHHRPLDLNIRTSIPQVLVLHDIPAVTFLYNTD